jgi:Spy/CpxP family protein refolding chaperone
MKKILFSLLIVSITATVQAQEMKDRQTEKPAIQESKKSQMQMDLKQLNLTEDQKATLKAQAKDFRQQMADLKKQDNITVKESREKMQALRQEQREKMLAVLTPEQKAQFDKMKTEGKAKQQEMGKERADKLKEQLGLSDEQSAKLADNRIEMAEKMKAIRNNTSLDDAAKKDQIKELMKQQKVFMKSVLTKEQIQKLKESREKGQGRKKDTPEMKETN